MQNKKTAGEEKKITILVLFTVMLTFPCAFADDLTGPSIISKSPSGLINQNPASLQISTDEISLCRYDTDNVPYSSMSNSFDGNSTDHSASLYLADNSYVYYAKCIDEYLNEGNVVQISFTLDTAPPFASNLQPSGAINDNRATLSLSTNEIAECRYSDSNTAFESMTAFSQTNSLNHKHELQGLAQGQKNYYIRCMDLAGNRMLYSEIISFTINTAPTASVNIEGNEPLKAGTYEVRLTTSEEMQSVPSLTYNFNDDSGMRIVSLTGSGTGFEGYMIIPASTPNKIGTFYFSGKDLSGATGTEVAAGKLFLIDTIPPPAPKDFNIEENKGNIKLQWYYQDEETDKFNIYRSEISEVNYVDYYDSSTETVYTDKNAEPGITYYYKISAVDKAGNEGALSIERHMLTAPGEDTQVIDKKNPVVSYKIQARLNLLEKDLINIESTISNLETTTEPEKLEIINNLDLVTKAKNFKESFAGLITQLQALKDTAITEADLDKTLIKLDQNAQKYKQGVAQDVIIQEKTTYRQVLEDADLDSAIDEFLLGKKLNDDQKTKYRQEMLSLSDSIDISAVLITAKIKYLDKDTLEERTFVKKQVTSKEPINMTSILEIIPKEVARRTDEILFKEPPVVLKSDPVVKWDVSSLSNKEIIYTFSELKDLNLVQKTKTVVLTGIPEESTNSTITGNVVDENKKPFKFDFNYLFIIGGIVAIAGLAVYYFFFMKIENKYEDGFIKQPKKIIQEESTDGIDLVKAMIGKGHYQINNLKFKEAYTYYLEVLDMLNASTSLRVAVDKEVEQLYYKLALCKRIKEAHGFVDTKNAGRLGQTIRSIKVLADLAAYEIDDRQPLAKLVKSSRAYFSDALKGMRIDPGYWNKRFR